MKASLTRLVPPEGWLAVGLVYLMGLTLAWAIDDARWFLGSKTHSDFLQAAVVGGITVSLIAARVGWGRWTGHLIGACFAALVVPLWVGERFVPGAAPYLLYPETAHQVYLAGQELATDGHILGHQFAPTLLAFGILVWGTGMFATTAVFRHRRPLAAIAAVGIVLLVNISITLSDQLGYLVLFCGASLFLLVRLHAVDEQTGWLRARLGDSRPVRTHTLRAGTAFVVAAVVGSIALTQVAASAPLKDAWPDDLEDGLIEVGQELANYFPFVTSVKGPGGQDFAANGVIQERWSSDGDAVFTAALPAGAPPDIYWRATAYDQFESRTWYPGQETTTPALAGASILDMIADPTVTDSRTEVAATITPVGGPRVAFAPGIPVSFDIDTDVITGGPSNSLVRVFVEDRDAPYEVRGTRLKIWTADDPAGVSANKLGVAGRTYPPAIVSQYAGRPVPALFGPSSEAFLAGIKVQVGSEPYDIAAEMERRFRSEFRYQADVSTVDCGDRGFVECFIQERVGFCMYFATAMVSLLREDGIPARLVMGYLPGVRTGTAATGFTETVTEAQAHAWVEVYFPGGASGPPDGWGWIAFDPTATLGTAQALPAGPPVPKPSPGARPSLPPNDIKRDFTPGGPQFGTPGADAGGGPGLVIVALLGLLVVVAGSALVIARVRAGRRGAVGVADSYRRVVGIASRFGYGPRPSQTIYEYANALGHLVPVARADLMTVAEARVETAYGRHALGSDRIAAVADAARRLRLSLLRLFFRRGPGRRTRTVRPRRG